MEKQKKINNIGFNMGMATMLWSFKMVNSSAKITPRQISVGEMRNFLKNITNEQNISYIALLDTSYFTIKWSEFKIILDRIKTFLNKIPYIRQRMDCDNFAFFMASLMSVIFGINTCGVTYGSVNIGHYWNAIVAEKEDGTLGLYYYDVKKVGYTEYKKGSKIKIGNWTYTPKSYRFF